MQITKKSSAHLIVPFIALDIGYFSVKGASHQLSNGQINNFIFPSVAPQIHSEISVHQGMGSYSGALVDVNNNKYFIGADARYFTKNLKPRTTNENYINSEDYKALYLGGLHHILKELGPLMKDITEVTINKVVGGLPLNTIQDGKTTVRSLFEGTHIVPGVSGQAPIKVEVKSASVIPQPQGALYSAAARRKPTEMEGFFNKNLLILDMGGGTFDWFMINEKKIIKARSDAYPKGMLSAVKEIVNTISNRTTDDEMLIKKVDDALRERKETVAIGGKSVALNQYSHLVANVMNDCLTVMYQSVGSFDALDGIIFTGGVADVLLEHAKKKYPDYVDLMELDANPVFSNVNGFFTLAKISSHG